MKRTLAKTLFLSVVFSLVAGVNYAQNAASTVPYLDAVIKELAGNLSAKLNTERAQKIAIDQFVYMSTLPLLSSYWASQLSQELINAPNRSFTIISTGPTEADWIVSGEIIEVANTIRVYTRLISSNNNAIAASFNSDIERNEQIIALLSSVDSQSGASAAPRDAGEDDSFENPVPYEISNTANAVTANRTFHNRDDEDFFLIIPNINGRLIMETTGNLDTLMSLYDAGTKELLAEDDDGGQGYNARIRHLVQAGKQYIAKITGYGATTGHYGFRAHMAGNTSSSWDSPVHYQIGSSSNAQVINRIRIDADDEDYFLLQPSEDGRLIIETTGSLDTKMIFYDANTRELLTGDDDSGENFNARIRYNVQAGRRYIAMVYGYSYEDIGNYGFCAYLQAPVSLAPDQYEPDNEPSQAKWIEIGVPQQHNFHNSDDVDWVRFQIQTPSRYGIRAKGVESNYLDTHIELFDADMYPIDENDDGGEYRDSYLSLYLGRGQYLLKISCLDLDPDQDYIISIEAE